MREDRHPGVVPGRNDREPVFEIRGVSKVFTRVREGREMATVALEGLDLGIRQGELVCLLGPSGCGKSTLLQLLAGLDRPTSGQIFYKGQPVKGTDTSRGFIFQRFNLFPWLTTADNVKFGLKLKGVPKAEQERIAHEKLRLVRLLPFKDHYPRELSGGMQQRVSIARTLALDPDVYLMDEPFGSLDAQTRQQMQDELLDLWQQMQQTTVVFVTHDIIEAILLGDRVVIMTARPGTVKKVVPIGLPRPRDRFGGEFGEIAKDVLGVLKEEIERSVAEELQLEEEERAPDSERGRTSVIGG